MKIRLVLADDHPLTLDGLEHLFADRDGYEVLARCANGAEALEAVRRHTPDILVLDLHMPKMSGVDVAAALHVETHPTRVIVLASYIDEDESLECLRLGVAGIVLKDMAPELVAQCVTKVANGDVWVEKRSFSRALEHLLRREAGLQGAAGQLTPRQLQIVQLCSEGLSNADIAARLWVTEGTVKSHLHTIYQKLGVDGRAALTRFALQNQLF